MAIFLKGGFMNECNYFKKDWLQESLVGLNGLEPSTSRLSGVRSNQLSYRPLIGAGDENRTHNISLEG
jgi:hypothetical protein